MYHLKLYPKKDPESIQIYYIIVEADGICTPNKIKLYTKHLPQYLSQLAKASLPGSVMSLFLGLISPGYTKPQS